MTDKRFEKFWSVIIKKMGIDAENHESVKTIFIECMETAGYFEDIEPTIKTKPKTKTCARGTGTAPKSAYYRFYAYRNDELKPEIKNGNERKSIIVGEWKKMTKAEKAEWGVEKPTEDDDDDDEEIKPKPRSKAPVEELKPKARRSIKQIEEDDEPKPKPKKPFKQIEEDGDVEKPKPKPKPKKPIKQIEEDGDVEEPKPKPKKPLEQIEEPVTSAEEGEIYPEED